jgi:hypothetical protein
LIFTTHKLFLLQPLVLEVRVLLALIELLQHKLLTLLLQHRLLRQLGVRNAVVNHVVEIEKVPIKECNSISLFLVKDKN